MEKSRIDQKTLKILEDLAECIIPSGGPDYPGSRDVGLVESLVEGFSRFKYGVLGLKVVAWLWQISPFLFSFKFRSFTSLSKEEQTRYLESWEKSKIMSRRFALMGTKALFMAGFYNNPMVWEKMGYEPGCFKTK